MDNITSIGGQKKEFRFQLAGSERVWAMPLMTSLPVSQAVKIAKLANVSNIGDQIDALTVVFESLCPGLIEELTMDEAAEVLRAWGAASGITLGESPAPSQS